jgi:hypothetical protein
MLQLGVLDSAPKGIRISCFWPSWSISGAQISYPRPRGVVHTGRRVIWRRL